MNVEFSQQVRLHPKTREEMQQGRHHEFQTILGQLRNEIQVREEPLPPVEVTLFDLSDDSDDATLQEMQIRRRFELLRTGLRMLALTHNLRSVTQETRSHYHHHKAEINHMLSEKTFQHVFDEYLNFVRHDPYPYDDEDMLFLTSSQHHRIKKP